MKSIETPILICGIGGYRNDSRRVRRNGASCALKSTGASRNDRGGRRRFTLAFHGAIALRVFSTRRHRPLGAAVASAAARDVGITFIAPPPCSQGSILILNTRFKRCA